MKLQLHFPMCSIEIESDKETELFEGMSRAYEVFAESRCGACQGEEIYPVTRTVGSGKQEFKYHEWKCRKCGAVLNLGQQDGGGLFPKRRLNEQGAPAKAGEEGKFGAHNGWTKYRGRPKEEEPAEAQQGTPHQGTSHQGAPQQAGGGPQKSSRPPVSRR